jgi:2-deoxy-D-gluconate 3-dehydrogenase
MILEAFQLNGKNALVTGSRRGLGKTIAIGLAEAGANVLCHGQDSNSGDVCDKIRDLGRKTGYLAADVARPTAAGDMIEKMTTDFGSIDILVNNAGIIRRAAASEHSVDDWDAVIAADLSAVFRLSQLAGRWMLEHQRTGKIVNIASLLSFQGGIRVPAYAAAKGGVVQLTKAFSNEWAALGINVNAIAPGYMATDNTEALRNDPVRSRQIQERIPAGRWGEPKDIAGAAVFLASNASDYVHGHVLVVDGGWLSR